MLKEERKSLRDELERIYGIRLRDDDELLPIIHFITEASKLANFNLKEGKELIAQAEIEGKNLLDAYTAECRSLLDSARENLSRITKIESDKIVAASKTLEVTLSLLNETKASIAALKIPEKIVMKKVSFDGSTMSFLWAYFTTSICLFVLLLTGSAIWINELHSQLKGIELSTTRYDWLDKYYTEISIQVPSLTKNFIKANPAPMSSKNLNPKPN